MSAEPPPIGSLSAEPSINSSDARAAGEEEPTSSALPVVEDALAVAEEAPPADTPASATGEALPTAPAASETQQRGDGTGSDDGPTVVPEGEASGVRLPTLVYQDGAVLLDGQPASAVRRTQQRARVFRRVCMLAERCSRSNCTTTS
jgi:hypothetical protein